MSKLNKGTSNEKPAKQATGQRAEQAAYQSHEELGQSQNPAELKRQALAEVLPEAFSEGQLDIEALKRALGEAVVDTSERYRLDWAGKSEAYKVLQTPSTATLRPQREQSINFDTAQHVFIEGENLEVLKVLQKAYFGKVKLIYIDPPYNTGNDSFIYPDRFQESKEDYLKRINELEDDGTLMREGFFRKNSRENGHYHSNWLNMMLPRLYIARNLLRDDGVIFISCDDNEVHNLRCLMNEVFGEENFRGQISRGTGTPTGQGTGRLVNEKDYLIVYAKSELFEFCGLQFTEGDEAIYDKEDENGRYLTRPLRKTGGDDRREDRPSMYYPVTSPNGTPVFPIGPGGYESRWRCGPKTYESLVEDGLIEWREYDVEGGKEWRVYQKFYLDGRTKQASNLWTEIVGNKKASRDLTTLLGGKYFDHPKPIELIKMCCLLSGNDGIVLDFFAGSGSTGHAVILANSEDQGHRKFVLVQLPEQTSFEQYATISDLCRDRLNRSIEEVRQESGLQFENGVYLGYKSLTLSPSNFKQWRGDEIESAEALAEQMQMFVQSEKDGAQTENILYELLLKFGQALTTPIEKLQIHGQDVYAIRDQTLLFVLNDFTEEMIEPLVALNAHEIIALDSAFHDSDELKTNLDLQCRDAGIRLTCL